MGKPRQGRGKENCEQEVEVLILDKLSEKAPIAETGASASRPEEGERVSCVHSWAAAFPAQRVVNTDFETGPGRTC